MLNPVAVSWIAFKSADRIILIAVGAKLMCPALGEKVLIHRVGRFDQVRFSRAIFSAK